MKEWLFLLSLFCLISCGDNSPFDEDYWDDSVDQPGQEEQTSSNEDLSASLRSLSLNSPDSPGTLTLNLRDNNATITIEMNDVPSDLTPAQFTFSNVDCDSILATNIPSTTTEIKSVNITENGTREFVVQSFNRTTGSTEPNPDFENQTVVVNAIAPNSTGSGQTFSVPFACGTLTRGGTTTGGTTTGGTTTGGTTTGGTTVGGTTTGGTTIVGAAGATAIGASGGLAGATTIGTSTGGIAGATTIGTFGGVTGTTTGGFTTGGVTGTSFGGFDSSL